MSYIIFIFIIIVFHICVDYCKGARPTCCHEASDLAMNSALIATAAVLVAMDILLSPPAP